MANDSIETKDDILKRLRRIEGQIKGIQRMVEEGQDCVDIITQVTAARAAINKVGSIILENHSRTCIEKAAIAGDREKALDELSKTVQSFMKFAD